MYRPPAFREDRLDVLLDAVRSHPLGTLVTSDDGFIVANVLPFEVHADGNRHILRAHLAKANDQIEALRYGGEAVIVFQGPQAYVSPSLYATKREHGRVVPTWNYVVVQVRGTPAIVDDTARLLEHLRSMTATRELDMEEPWSVSDAPSDYIAAQMRGIVGLEIPIGVIEGKWKMSQNQPAANKTSIIEGLRRDGRADLADTIASRCFPDGGR